MSVWQRPGNDPTVLIHGLTGTSRWWARVIEHLPESRGLIALDVRGRGQSRESPPPYELTSIADDVARCLDHFEIERAVVAGYSMGGWATALFGTHYPDRVDRLVLVDGGLPMPRPQGVDPDQAIDAIVGPALARLDIEFRDENDYIAHWRSHPSLSSSWDDVMAVSFFHELEHESDVVRVRANREAIAINGREIVADPEANAATSSLQVQAHVIVVERGPLDQPGGMIPKAVADSTANANPHVTYEYLSGLNHYTLMLGAGAPRVAGAIVG